MFLPKSFTKMRLPFSVALVGLLLSASGGSGQLASNSPQKEIGREVGQPIIGARGVTQRTGDIMANPAATGTTGNSFASYLLGLPDSASAAATVLHGTSPRLLTYDGIDIEPPLSGTFVAIRNQDVPWVVGRIGTLVGEQSINIDNFALVRSIRSPRIICRIRIRTSPRCARTRRWRMRPRSTCGSCRVTPTLTRCSAIPRRGCARSHVSGTATRPSNSRKVNIWRLAREKPLISRA